MDSASVLVASDFQDNDKDKDKDKDKFQDEDNDLSANAIVSQLKWCRANCIANANNRNELAEKLRGKTKSVVIVIRDNIDNANSDIKQWFEDIQESGQQLKATVLIYFHVHESREPPVNLDSSLFDEKYGKYFIYMIDKFDEIKKVLPEFLEKLKLNWRVECISRILNKFCEDDGKNMQSEIKSYRIYSRRFLTKDPLLPPPIPANKSKLLQKICPSNPLKFNDKKPLVYIINNVQVNESNAASAHNSVIDRENLNRLFGAMQYDVWVYEGLSKEQLVTVTETFSKTGDRPFYIFILMTDLNDKGYIKFPNNSNDSMKYSELLKLMYSKDSKIRNKPRFVVLHSWVSEKDNSNLNEQNGAVVIRAHPVNLAEYVGDPKEFDEVQHHDQRGLIVVYSVSWRRKPTDSSASSNDGSNNGKGTRFILALCDKIKKSAEANSKTDLTSMIIPINKEVTDGGLELEDEKTRDLKDLPCPVWTLQNDDPFWFLGRPEEGSSSPNAPGDEDGNPPDDPPGRVGVIAPPALGEKPKKKYRALIIGQPYEFTSGINLMKATQDFAAVLASRWFQVTHVFTDDIQIPADFREEGFEASIVLVISRDKNEKHAKSIWNELSNNSYLIYCQIDNSLKDVQKKQVGTENNDSKKLKSIIFITGPEGQLKDYLQELTTNLKNSTQVPEYDKCFPIIGGKSVFPNGNGSFQWPIRDGNEKYGAWIVREPVDYNLESNLRTAVKDFTKELKSRGFEFPKDRDPIAKKFKAGIVLVISHDNLEGNHPIDTIKGLPDESHLIYCEVKEDGDLEKMNHEVNCDKKSIFHMKGTLKRLGKYLQELTTNLKNSKEEHEYNLCFPKIKEKTVYPDPDGRESFKLPTPCFNLISKDDTKEVGFKGFDNEVYPVASSFRQNISELNSRCTSCTGSTDPRPLHSMGLALIIANCAYERDDDKGKDYCLPDVLFDCTNYVDALSLMGYSVTVKLNLAKIELEKAIEGFANNEHHGKCSILIVLSHGYLHNVSLPSGEPVDEAWILKCMCEGEKAITKIKKFVVFDCCRNEPKPRSPESSNEEQRWQSSNLIVCYATSPGDYSCCRGHRGGYFSIALCRELCNLYCEYNETETITGLTSLATKVNKVMMTEYGKQIKDEEKKEYFYQLPCWMIQSNEEIHLIDTADANVTNGDGGNNDDVRPVPPIGPYGS